VFILGFNPSAGKKTGIGERGVRRTRPRVLHRAEGASRRLPPTCSSRGTGSLKQATASRIVLEGLSRARAPRHRGRRRLGLTVSEDEIHDSIFHGLRPRQLAERPRDPDAADARHRRRPRERRLQGPRRPSKFDMKTYERMVKQITGRSPNEFREWQGREILAPRCATSSRRPSASPRTRRSTATRPSATTSTVNYVVVRRSWLEKYAIPAEQKDIDAWSKDKVNLAQSQGARPAHPREVRGREARGARRRQGQGPGHLRPREEGRRLQRSSRRSSRTTPAARTKGGMYPARWSSSSSSRSRTPSTSVKPGELVPQTLVETQFGYHVIRPTRRARKTSSRPTARREVVSSSRRRSHRRFAAAT